MAPLELVAKLATRWRHLHKFQIWPPDGATRNGHLLQSITCITCITCLTIDRTPGIPGSDKNGDFLYGEFGASGDQGLESVLSHNTHAGPVPICHDLSK